MDFSKAFSKVDHHKLVHILKHMGVNKYLTTSVKYFLHNRSQQVVIENKVAHRLPVLSCVPQGSVIGPILFLAYIIHLSGSVRSRVRLFEEQNRTEHNLFKTCTKYIVFFIYNITNIVMSCNRYTETE